MYLCSESIVLISRWQRRVISVLVIIQTLSDNILIALKHCLSLVFYFSSSNKWILCLVSLRHFLKHWNRHPVTVESQENILKNTWPGSVASTCNPNVPANSRHRPLEAAGQGELAVREESVREWQAACGDVGGMLWGSHMWSSSTFPANFWRTGMYRMQTVRRDWITFTCTVCL